MIINHKRYDKSMQLAINVIFVIIEKVSFIVMHFICSEQKFSFLFRCDAEFFSFPHNQPIVSVIIVLRGNSAIQKHLPCAQRHLTFRRENM